jgi:hypothetical protein
VQDTLYALPYIRPIGIQHNGIEIALDADWTQALPGMVKIDAKIYPDDVATCLAHEL